MTVLHNRISQKELRERLYQETEARTTLSFYNYFTITDPSTFRDDLYRQLEPLKIFGRMYVASEGINAQLSVPQNAFEEFQKVMNAIPGLDNIRLNIAVDDNGKSFWVLKIKVRDKIVADGIVDSAFSMENKGRYVDAESFNHLTSLPDTIVVDMRNHYEYEVGHFEDAIEVPSDTFREQLPMAAEMLKEKKDTNIILYCTGGIRCEKASAFLLYKGFRNVFHLEGGIVQYANTVRKKGLTNKFKGKNFVFDERLGERISEEIIAKCHQCGKHADTHTNCKNSACHLLFIQCDSCGVAFNGCCSIECQTIYQLPEEEQKKLRKGKSNGIIVFNKSRHRKKKL